MKLISSAVMLFMVSINAHSTSCSFHNFTDELVSALETGVSDIVRDTLKKKNIVIKDSKVKIERIFLRPAFPAVTFSVDTQFVSDSNRVYTLESDYYRIGSLLIVDEYDEFGNPLVATCNVTRFGAFENLSIVDAKFGTEIVEIPGEELTFPVYEIK